MSKSIMHQKDGTCYLCMMLKGDYDDHKITEEHHAVFGTANRNIAEHYGLKVYLCPEHHRTGKEAVHRNYKITKYLQERAQVVPAVLLDSPRQCLPLEGMSPVAT